MTDLEFKTLEAMWEAVDECASALNRLERVSDTFSDDIRNEKFREARLLFNELKKQQKDD